jgi:hypothetical protein
MTKDDPIDYTKLAAQIDPEQIAAEMDTRRIGDTDQVMLKRRQIAAIAGSGIGVGALSALGIGSAEANPPGDGNGEAGVIGDKSAGEPVDLFCQDVEVEGEFDVSNGSTTGLGSAIKLTSSDSITIDTINRGRANQTFQTLFNGSSSTVLGGSVTVPKGPDFEYTFSDGTVTTPFGTSGYNGSSGATNSEDGGGDAIMAIALPPAEKVTQVRVGGQGGELGAHLYRI